jgi:SAM-dependent methyltransferase
MASKNQDRLTTFFAGQAPEAHPTRWDDLWKAGDFLPWDRGFPNPALFDTLLDHPATFGTSLKPDGTRKRALVPGCGKGYDLVLLSAFGYDAWGVEYSKNAVKAANEFLASTEKEDREEYKVRDEKVGRGVQKSLFGDFFSDDWVKETGGMGEGFDLIYDCTVGRNFDAFTWLVGFHRVWSCGY